MGRRRSWMLLAQLGIVAGLSLMAFSDPRTDTGLFWIAIFGLVVAFSSATQDITIDAYRIDSAPGQLQAAMAAMYILGYRIALIVADAGVLFIASISGFSQAYLCMAALMFIGIVTTIVIREPEKSTEAITARQADILAHSKNHSKLPPRLNQAMAWIMYSVVSPFMDFFKRNGLLAIAILLFISLFRVSDLVMGIMAKPFYQDLGFSLNEIGTISGVFGPLFTILGAFIGGILVARQGLYKPLLIGALLVMITNLFFSWLAVVDPTMIKFALVVCTDSFSAGIATTAFIAYLSSLTNTAYTATQYALFSSLMTLPGKTISGFSGLIVDNFGFASFFIYAAALGLPAIGLILYLSKKIKTDP